MGDEWLELTCRMLHGALRMPTLQSAFRISRSIPAWKGLETRAIPSISADRHQGRAMGIITVLLEGDEMFILEIAERPRNRLPCRSQARGDLLMGQGHSDLTCVRCLLFI